MKKLDEVLNTLDDSDIGYSVEVDLKYPDIIKKENKEFSILSWKKVLPKDKNNDYMKQNLKFIQKLKKLKCDWSHKKKFFIHDRMLEVYVRHSMVVEKIHEIISVKQSKWLEKHICFHTEKRKKARNGIEKDFCKLLNSVFFWTNDGKYTKLFKNRNI